MTGLTDHTGDAPAALAGQIALWSATDAAQFTVAFLGLLLALAALPRALKVATQSLRAQPEAQAIGVALLIGLGLRLVVPARLVMLFSGYELVERSSVLTAVHRYGAGSQVLHRLLFLIAPADHASLFVLHRLLGALSLVPLLAWFSRWPPPPRALVFAALGLATLPLLVRDAATESILVVGALWLWSGLLLLAVDGLTWRVVALLAAAAMTRPELAIVAPLLAWLVLRRDQPKRLSPLHVLLFALLVAPQLWHMVERMLQDAAAGTNRLNRLVPFGPLAALGGFLPFWPLAFPFAWTLLALMGLRQAETWHRHLALLTFLWTCALLVDLPQTSVPRLEAPLAALWLLLGAWHLASVPPRLQRRLGAIVLLTTLPTLQLFKPTNEDAAERFTRAALTHLPPQDACLVTLHESDPPDKGKVQRAFPDYLLRPPHRTVKRLAMQQWAQAGAPQCPGGTFLLIEHRCYAVFHHPASDPAMLPICRATLDQHDWQPIAQERAVNHGQNEYGWYPPVPAFELGLYRLVK